MASEGFEMTIEWDSGAGPGDYVSDLNSFRSEFLSSLNNAAQSITEQGVNMAQDRAPVDTGELRRSIRGHVEDMMEQTAINIIAGADHAPHQEYGTIYMAAQPYLRPTLEALGPVVRDQVKSAWDSAISSAF